MIILTTEELVRYIELGNCPPVVYCEKKYEGICCLLRVTKNNTVFLDYDHTYENDSEGGFRATFIFDSFEKMISSIEKFTHKSIAELTINPYCYELFESPEPQYTDFHWDVYNGKIDMMEDYADFFIGDFYWNGLYHKKFKPDASTEEIIEWIKKYQDERLKEYQDTA